MLSKVQLLQPLKDVAVQGILPRRKVWHAPPHSHRGQIHCKSASRSITWGTARSSTAQSCPLFQNECPIELLVSKARWQFHTILMATRDPMTGNAHWYWFDCFSFLTHFAFGKNMSRNQSIDCTKPRAPHHSLQLAVFCTASRSSSRVSAWSNVKVYGTDTPWKRRIKWRTACLMDTSHVKTRQKVLLDRVAYSQYSLKIWRGLQTRFKFEMFAVDAALNNKFFEMRLPGVGVLRTTNQGSWWISLPPIPIRFPSHRVEKAICQRVPNFSCGSPAEFHTSEPLIAATKTSAEYELSSYQGEEVANNWLVQHLQLTWVISIMPWQKAALCDSIYGKRIAVSINIFPSAAVRNVHQPRE